MTTKNLTIELTFGQAVALYDVLKAVHGDSDYYTERALKGDLEELSANVYILNDAERNVEKRAHVAGLISLITGEPFGDPTEAERLRLVREAYDHYKAAQPELAEA